MITGVAYISRDSVIVQWIRSGYSVDENTLVQLLFKMNKNLLEGVTTK